MTKKEAKALSDEQRAIIERRTQENIRRAAEAARDRAAAAAPLGALGMPSSSIRQRVETARVPGSDIAFDVTVWLCAFGDEAHVASDEAEARAWVQGRKAAWTAAHARAHARNDLARRCASMSDHLTTTLRGMTTVLATSTDEPLVDAAEQAAIHEVLAGLAMLAESLRN